MLSASSLLHRSLALSITGLIALLAGGCLDRKEQIDIHPDGSVWLRSEFKGDPGDFVGGDALPEPGSAWKVTDEHAKKPDGDEEMRRTAVLDIGAGRPLPATYAANAADADVSLSFPSTLTMEKRDGGTYYRFTRTYQHREDARFTTVKRTMEQDSKKRGLLDGEPSTMSQEDRQQLLEAFRKMEIEKQIQYIEAAGGTLSKHPPEAALRIRQAAIEAGKAFDTARAGELLARPPSPERDKAIDALAAGFIDMMRAAVHDAMAREKLTPGEAAAFDAALHRQVRMREVTEDLQDEHWEVRLTLPGQVVASNADETEGGQLVWTFGPLSIMDRDQIIQATSFVADKK